MLSVSAHLRCHGRLLPPGPTRAREHGISECSTIHADLSTQRAVRLRNRVRQQRQRGAHGLHLAHGGDAGRPVQRAGQHAGRRERARRQQQAAVQQPQQRRCALRAARQRFSLANTD